MLKTFLAAVGLPPTIYGFLRTPGRDAINRVHIFGVAVGSFVGIVGVIIVILNLPLKL